MKKIERNTRVCASQETARGWKTVP